MYDLGPSTATGDSLALRTEICDRLGLEAPIFGFARSIEVVVEVIKKLVAEAEEALEGLGVATDGR